MTGRPSPETHPGFQGEPGACRHPGDQTLAELSEQFGVHANRIKQWKRQLPEGAVDVLAVVGRY